MSNKDNNNIPAEIFISILTVMGFFPLRKVFLYIQDKTYEKRACYTRPYAILILLLGASLLNYLIPRLLSIVIPSFVNDLISLSLLAAILASSYSYFAWEIFNKGGLKFKFRRSSSPFFRFGYIEPIGDQFHPGHSNEIRESFLNGHTLCSAPTGKGKTVSILIENTILGLSNGYRKVIVDAKGDRTLRDLLFSNNVINGKEKKMVYFSLAEPEISSCFLLFDGASKEEIVDMIMSATKWSEIHYKKVAQNVLIKALNQLDKDNPTLEEIYNCIPETKGTEGIRADLGNLISYDFYPLFCPKNRANAFSFEDLLKVDGPDVIYFDLSSMSFPELSKQVYRLILASMKCYANRVQRTLPEVDRPRISLELDEFGKVYDPIFNDFLSQARASKIDINAYTQSIADLTEFGLQKREQLIENFQNFIFMGSVGAEQREFNSRLIGTKTTVKKTDRATDSNFGESKSGETSIREVEEFWIHPKDFLSLEKGEAVLLTTAPFGVYKMVLTAPSRVLQRKSYSEKVKRNYDYTLMDFFDDELKKFLTKDKKNTIKYFVQGYPVPDEYYIKESLKRMKISGRLWNGNLREHFRTWINRVIKEEDYEFDWEYQQVLAADKIYTLDNFDSKLRQPDEWCL